MEVDSAPDLQSDGQWITFAELAKRRGISAPSAARLVRRKQWRRQKDNKGHVLIYVPSDWLTNEEDESESAATSAMQEAFRVALAAKDEVISELRSGLDRARSDAASAQASVVRAELEAATAQERLRQLEAAEAARRGQGRLARLRAAWRGG